MQQLRQRIRQAGRQCTLFPAGTACAAAVSWTLEPMQRQEALLALRRSLPSPASPPAVKPTCCLCSIYIQAAFIEAETIKRQEALLEEEEEQEREAEERQAARAEVRGGRQLGEEAHHLAAVGACCRLCVAPVPAAAPSAMQQSYGAAAAVRAASTAARTAAHRRPAAAPLWPPVLPAG